MLPKDCKKYAGWRVSFLEELFQYCEPGTFSITKKQVDSLQNARQMVEFGFGIKAGFSDGKSGSITNLAKGLVISKKECFDALRSSYLALGSCLRKLAIVEGTPFGSIRACTRSSGSKPRTSRSIALRCTIVACTPEDLVRGMTMKDFDVHQKFSFDSAYVMVLWGDTLVLESLFPRI